MTPNFVGSILQSPRLKTFLFRCSIVFFLLWYSNNLKDEAKIRENLHALGMKVSTAYKNKKECGEVLPDLIKIILIDRNYLIARFNIAKCYSVSLRLREAKELFKEELRYRPTNLEALIWSLFNRILLGENPRLISDIWNAKSTGMPEGENEKYMVAAIMGKIGDESHDVAALSMYDDLIEINPNNYFPHIQKAIILSRRGMWAHGRKEFEKAKSLGYQGKMFEIDLRKKFQSIH